MLVTFTTDAHEDITMFGDVAVQLIKMMGQSGAVPSALKADSVPAALANLQAAVAQQQNKSTPPSQQNTDYDDDADEVSLAHRAIPLIELLQHAAQKHCDVLWG